MCLWTPLNCYKHLQTLRNACNDARDLRAFVVDHDFEVIFVLDGTAAQLKEHIKQFNKMLGPGVVGLVFYAGHGVEIDGENYLLPVDIKTDDPDQTKHDAVSLEVLLGQMERRKSLLNIAIVDACRSNLDRGDSDMVLPPAPAGSIVLFGTSSGASASDGTGRNG